MRDNEHPPGVVRSGGRPRRRVHQWLDEFEYVVSALALIGLVGMLTISILARYVAGLSVPWSEEVARFLFIAVIYSSISYAARQQRHIRITMFIEKALSSRARRLVLSIGDLVWLGFNAVVLYGAYVIILDMWEFPFSSPVLNIPMYYIYAVIPVFFIALSVRVVQGIGARFSDDVTDRQAGDW